MTIKLNGSTAGSVSLDAPASTTSNADIQFKLPVADGSTGQVLQTDGSGNLSWVSLPSVPTANPAYTYIDQWALTSNIQLSSGGTRHWAGSELARSNSYAYTIGTAMTVDSNGIFTFPATGVYKIYARHQIIANNVNSRYIGAKIEKSTNSGSSFSHLGNSIENMSALSGATYVNMEIESFFDVTDTSTHKVRFGCYSADTYIIVQGSDHASQAPTTFFRFIKIAET